MLTLTCHNFSYRGRGIFLSSDLFAHRQNMNMQVLNLKSKAALRLAGLQDKFFWKGTGSQVVMYCGWWWWKVRILGRDSNQVIALWPKCDFGSDVHLFGKQHLRPPKFSIEQRIYHLLIQSLNVQLGLNSVTNTSLYSKL